MHRGHYYENINPDHITLLKTSLPIKWQEHSLNQREKTERGISFFTKQFQMFI